MADHNVRTRPLARPFAPEGPQIIHPDTEIFDMTGIGIITQPARSTLPTPVKRRDRPAGAMPMGQRLKILLVEIPSSAQEQN